MQPFSSILSTEFFLSFCGHVFIGVFLIYLLHRRTSKRRITSKSLLLKAMEKRKERDARLNEPLSPLKLSPETQQAVLNASVTTLSKMLNNDEVTSEEVLLVYLHRARTIGLAHDLLADVNFSDALEMARICDKKRQETPKDSRDTLGPLFGIPISVKDNIRLKGLDATFGLASRCFQPQKDDAVVVQILKKNGVIPFIKSSGPQMMTTIETISNIWGRAKNPWNPSRTVGGSSGGEGGLIAARCSPLGIGSDVGGSVRIPALYCGVYGLKPTAERLSPRGLVYPNKAGRSGNTFIKPVIGPLGKCVDDLRMITKTMMTSDDLTKLDPKVFKLGWNHRYEEEPLGKMRIGFFDNDEYFETGPANKRAVKEACEAIKQKGHEIISLNGLMPSLQRVQHVYTAILTAEGKLRSFYEALQGEPILQEYNQWVIHCFLPRPLRYILSKLLTLFGHRREAELMKHTGEKQAHELFEYTKDMEIIKDEVINLWKTYQLDAIITPGLALPAIKHGQARYLHLNACYTLFWNLVNFPTGAVPITKVEKHETYYNNCDRKHKGDKFDTFAQECLEDAQGLPVGIQISTMPFEDEKCLGIMKEIEQLVGFHEYPL